MQPRRSSVVDIFFHPGNPPHQAPTRGYKRTILPAHRGGRLIRPIDVPWCLVIIQRVFIRVGVWRLIGGGGGVANMQSHGNLWMFIFWRVPVLPRSSSTLCQWLCRWGKGIWRLSLQKLKTQKNHHREQQAAKHRELFGGWVLDWDFKSRNLLHDLAQLVRWV